MTDAWSDQTEVTRISGGMINAESIYVGGVGLKFDETHISKVADAVIEEIQARYPGILNKLQGAE